MPKTRASYMMEMLMESKPLPLPGRDPAVCRVFRSLK